MGGIQVERKRFAPGSELAWHHHSGAYGCVLLRGAAREEVGSVPHELERLDGTLRPPGVGHRVLFGRGGAEVVTFEIESARLRTLSGDRWSLDRFLRRRSGVLGALGRRVTGELPGGDDSSALVLEGLVLELLGELMRLRPVAAPVMPVWLERVRDRLHDEPGRRLTHEELAREAGVHPVHLAQTFRRFFGQPPAAYHRRLRLERAAQRLSTTDEPLAEIAIAAGYCDQAHFSNAFKRAMGLTPMAYRRTFIPSGIQET